MNTASRPPIHAAAAPSDAGVPNSASERAASAVMVTGLALANAWSQCGMVETGTNTELANTSGQPAPAASAAWSPWSGLALAPGYDTAFWWTAGIFVRGAVIVGALLRPGPPGKQGTPRHMPRRQPFKARQ